MVKHKSFQNAFPTPHRYFKDTGKLMMLPGMTIREFAAIQAMTGILSNSKTPQQMQDADMTEVVAISAVNMADALIAQLEITKKDL